MIKFYCQYSYGGFKTFRINGEVNEPLSQEVTTKNTYEFPQLADLYFNQEGTKILYRYIDKDTLILVVREIPSLGLDTDNRKICCAVQFVGDSSDREIMDRIAIRILNNLDKFQSDFADMFDLRGGLHFEGDRLTSIVDECKFACHYEGDSKLLNIQGRKGTVLLFVPLSEQFGISQAVTDKILSELKLPQETLEGGRFMSHSELNRMQYLLDIRNDEGNLKKDVDDSNTDTKVKDHNKSLEELEKELEEKKQECAQLRKTASESMTKCKQLKEEKDLLEQKFNKLILVGGGVLGASILLNAIFIFSR